MSALQIHFSRFLIARILNAGISSAGLIIFSRLLSPSDYGLASAVTAAGSILAIGLGLNLAHSIPRYFHDAEFNPGKNERVAFVSAQYLITGCFAVLFLVLAWMARSQFSQWLAIPEDLLILAIPLALYHTWVLLEERRCVADQNSKRAALILIASAAFLLLGGCLGAVMWESAPLYGKACGEALVATAGALISLFYGAKFQWLRSFGGHLLYAAKFALPRLPFAFGTYTIFQLDRIMLNKMLGAGAAGLFSVSLNIGMLIVMVTSSVSAAVLADYYKSMNRSDFGRVELVNKNSFLFMCLACTGALLFSDVIIKLLAGEQYINAAKCSAILSVAFLLNGLCSINARPFDFGKSTAALSLITVVAAGFKLIANYILVPIFEIEGAAASTLLSYCLFAVMLNQYSVRVLNIHSTSLRFFLGWTAIFSAIGWMAFEISRVQASLFFQLSIKAVGLSVVVVTAAIVFDRLNPGMLASYKRRVMGLK